MALVARIRRLSLVLAAASVLVAPALAGERVSPGCTDDAQAKNRPTPSVDGGAPAGSAAARAARTSINPTDDIYAPKPKPSAGSPAPQAPDLSPAPATVHAPAPGTPAPDRKRESATSISRTQRNAPPRVKVSIRNLPATPGMGTLLRVGVTSGSEISLLDQTVPFAPQRAHSGRAPPRGPTLANFAPAALPGAPPPAAPLRVCPPSRGTAPPQSSTPPHSFAQRPAQGLSHAAAPRLAACPDSRTTERRPRTRSGAGRSESAPPRDSSRLSGGRTT